MNVSCMFVFKHQINMRKFSKRNVLANNKIVIQFK